MSPILYALNFQIIKKAAVCFHAKLYLLDDIFWRNITGSKSKYNFSLRVMRKRHNFLGFPCDFIVSEWISGRDTLAIHDHKLFAKVHANVNIIEPMFPFLVYLIFESKLYITAAHFPCINKQ